MIYLHLLKLTAGTWKYPLEKEKHLQTINALGFLMFAFGGVVL